MRVDPKQVLSVLQQTPRLDARGIAERLRRLGLGDIHKRDINPILYALPDLFHREGDAPPIWISREARPIPKLSNGISREGASGKTVSLPTPPRPNLSNDSPAIKTPARPPEMASKPANSPSGLTTEKQENFNLETWPVDGLSPYRWQSDAYAWWLQNGRTGIVEAVTGTGKTIVGIAAIARSIQSGSKALILVPSIVLQEQWVQRLNRYLPNARLAMLGGSSGTQSAGKNHNVLVAVINSAANSAQQLEGIYSLVVADECHRYGATSFRKALLSSASDRLGLTATLERLDDGVDDALLPYFGTPRYIYDFDRATSDKVLASFVVANVGIELTSEERDQYEVADQLCRQARATLINKYGYPASIAEFMPKAANAAQSMITFYGEGKFAKQYMVAFRKRIKILAETPGRLDALKRLAPAINLSGGTIAFTETVDMANRAASELNAMGVKAAAFHSEISTSDRQSRLNSLQEKRLQAIIGVKALDEGVDVPNVNLGIIMSASHQKRQMIQRLGRIVRKKPDDSYAVLINFFAKYTSEDPRDGNHEGFMNAVKNGADEIELFTGGCDSDLLAFVEKYLKTIGTATTVKAETIALSATEAIAAKTGIPSSAQKASQPALLEVGNRPLDTLLHRDMSIDEHIKKLELELADARSVSAKQAIQIEELAKTVNKLGLMLTKSLEASKSTALDGGAGKVPPSQVAHSNTWVADASPSGYVSKPEKGRFDMCRQCGGDGGAGGRCPRCGGNGFEP